ncbi:MAG: aminotransferase class I/II-fold pyridoxal phosphate-dependent enzyme [Bacteroidales bacterium]|jgi:methionine-gamma-lyase|nr:aminotransferase class I/II-fold pyridoxal phosphate-dependent enzyme [Bacteroidales bacterium]
MKHFDPAAAINAAQHTSAERGINPSINDSATFTFEHGQTMTDTFHGETEGLYLYSRNWNPSATSLCRALAAMEGTEAAWCTGSGMAAITCALLQCLQKGDHCVASMTVYGGTFAFLDNYCKRLGIEVTFVDSTNFAEVQAACKPNTKVIYTETMSNPLLRISNIPKLREVADKAGAKLIVDNTFTPMIFSPYKLGAHIVVYSMTKFINGKNDCVAGAICADNDFVNSLVDVNSGTAMLLGPVLDSYRATSILKNLYTLHIRMQQHSKNAMYLAKRFNEIGIKANYPGLEEHIDHNVMKEQMNESFGYGGMIAIDLITAERANDLMEKMQEKGIGFLAVSLGYFRTLFSCSGKSTSSEVPDDIQQKMGMSEGLVRYSVGLDNDIEHTFSLIEDCLKELKYI